MARSRMWIIAVVVTVAILGFLALTTPGQELLRKIHLAVACSSDNCGGV